MAVEELSELVCASLEATGALQKIRAELRAHVFAAIHEQAVQSPQFAPAGSISAPLSALKRSEEGRVTLGLVCELLRACALEYTASVYIPEAAIGEAEAPPRDQLARQLGLVCMLHPVWCMASIWYSARLQEKNNMACQKGRIRLAKPAFLRL
eukprot:6182268-Pleurochrysis_carterae.AAC.1